MPRPVFALEGKTSGSSIKMLELSMASVAKFIFSYGVGCRKKVTSQGCKMQQKQDDDL